MWLNILNLILLGQGHSLAIPDQELVVLDAL